MIAGLNSYCVFNLYHKVKPVLCPTSCEPTNFMVHCGSHCDSAEDCEIINEKYKAPWFAPQLGKTFKKLVSSFTKLIVFQVTGLRDKLVC
jgi:hypothetical protein